MSSQHAERRRTLRAELDEPLDPVRAEAEAMRLVGELADRVARDRANLRALRDHLEG